MGGDQTVTQRLTDPSSEAEALSHVASGIATSLGLTANATNEQNSNEQDRGPTTEHEPGPLADLENYETNSQIPPSSGAVNYQPISESSGENHISTESHSSTSSVSHERSSENRQEKNVNKEIKEG